MNFSPKATTASANEYFKKRHFIFTKKICSNFPLSIFGKTLSNDIDQANACASNSEMKLQLSSKIR